jgi:hypothetical protein
LKQQDGLSQDYDSIPLKQLEGFIHNIQPQQGEGFIHSIPPQQQDSFIHSNTPLKPQEAWRERSLP